MLMAETLINLHDVAKEIPPISGQKLHYATVHRWVSKGYGGVTLEAYRIGSKWVTSKEAVARFIAATTALPPMAKPRKNKTKPAPLLSISRERALDRAERKLVAAGC